MPFATSANIYVGSTTSPEGEDWEARAAADVRRPALFVYLDWPSGEVRASTFHKSLTIEDGTSPSPVWAGVGNFAFFETESFGRDSAMVTHRIGLTSLPQSAITEETEAAAIGRRAKIYEGLFDAAWANPVLKQIFTGFIVNAGKFELERDENRNWRVSASVEVSNWRHPRRLIQNHHGPETAEDGDTGWNLLPTVATGRTWPWGG